MRIRAWCLAYWLIATTSLVEVRVAAAVPGGNAGEPTLRIDAGGHTSAVTGLWFAGDGRHLISGGRDGTVRVWDLDTAESVHVIRPRPAGQQSSLSQLACTVPTRGETLMVAEPDAEGAAVLVDSIDVKSGRLVRQIRLDILGLGRLAVNPRGDQLATTTPPPWSMDHAIRLWDDRGRCVGTLLGHRQTVVDLAFSPDGRLLASTSSDKQIRIWTTHDGRCTATLQLDAPAWRVGWRPDGRVLAGWGMFGDEVRQWAPDGSPYQGIPDSGRFFSYLPDSNRVLVASPFRSNQTPEVRIDHLLEHRALATYRGPGHNPSCGAISPDGSLAATGDQAGEIHLWRTRDGQPVHRLARRGQPMEPLAWSRDGRSIGLSPRSGSFPSPALQVRPEDVGRTLAIASADRAFDLTNLSLGDPHHEFVQTVDWLSCVTNNYARNGKLINSMSSVAPRATFSPDRHRFVDEWDGIISVRQVDRGPATPQGPPPMRENERILSLFFVNDDWIAWTPEGFYAASPGGERLMGWEVSLGDGERPAFYPAEKFRKSFYRPDVVRHVLETGSTAKALARAALDGGTGPAQAPTPPATPGVVGVLPPVVDVVRPRDGAKLQSGRIEVEAVARARGDRPIASLRLLVDGRPYQGQAGVRPIRAGTIGPARATWSIELEPGAHRLSVLADGAASQGTSDPVEVTFEAAEAVELPRLYVLAVGISTYPGDRALDFAASDAEAIDRVFRERSGPLFREVKSRLLTDARATCKEVTRGLSWLKGEMTQKDVAIVFFSGHGVRDTDGSFYLAPVDADPADPMTTAVPDSTLKKALAGMPGRVVCLLDACHTGALMQERRKGLGGLADDLIRDLVTDDYGVVVMSSSMGAEESLEDPGQRHGAFTAALVEGLSGRADMNSDGAVYLNELDSYVTDRVKALTRGRQHPNTAKPSTIRSFPLARPH